MSTWAAVSAGSLLPLPRLSCTEVQACKGEYSVSKSSTGEHQACHNVRLSRTALIANKQLLLCVETVQILVEHCSQGAVS